MRELVHWKKTFATAALAVALTAGVAFANGLSLGLWLDRIPSVDDAIRFSRLTRNAAIVVIVGLLYWRLCRTVNARPLLHVGFAWLLALGMDFLLGAALAFLLHLPSNPGAGFGYIVSTLLAALFGYVIYRLLPNNSSKPTPLRGAA
ncbi:hypothetical protein [Lysobacter xanthus]